MLLPQSPWLDAVLNWLSYGLFDLSGWQVLGITLLLTHITIASVTIYLHRHSAHRALDLHPIPAHFFRFWLWLAITADNTVRGRPLTRASLAAVSAAASPGVANVILMSPLAKRATVAALDGLGADRHGKLVVILGGDGSDYLQGHAGNDILVDAAHSGQQHASRPGFRYLGGPYRKCSTIAKHGCPIRVEQSRNGGRLQRRRA
mgnify:CR=1 FL=1